MSFLPEGYKKIPSNSDYMKFQDGENVIRVLSSAVVGYEYWTEDSKPVRAKQKWDGVPADCKEEDDGTFKINHFWAFAVWNYDEKKVMILEITQKTVMQGIKALVENKRWGDPKNYDILITKTKDGGKTSYQTQALPPIGEPDETIREAYAKKTVNLEALFTGADPFKPQDSTAGIGDPFIKPGDIPAMPVQTETVVDVPFGN